MEAIILAGGFGTRLHSVIRDIPKPMAPIQGKPFLEILLANLHKKGFKRVILSLGFMSNFIQSYFESSFLGMEIIYSIEDEPLGTGGAIKLALKYAKNDHVFIFNGDTFLDLEILDIETLWLKHKKPILVAIKVQDSSRYGGVEVDAGVLVSFAEKCNQTSELINAGCYVLPKNQLANFTKPFNRFSFEQDYLSSYKGQIQVFISKGLFIDIGIPKDFQNAQNLLLNFI